MLKYLKPKFEGANNKLTRFAYIDGGLTHHIHHTRADFARSQS